MNDMNSFVASRVLPWVPVTEESGTYPVYTKKYWFSNNVEERAYGADYPAAGYGLSSGTYKTLQYALSHPVPDEVEALSQTPLSLRQSGIRFLSQNFAIKREREFATLFMANASWTSEQSGGDSGYTKWSDTASSDPVGNLKTMKRTISQLIGRQPNVVVCGEIVWDRLTEHPDVIDRIKYTDLPADASMPAKLAAITGIANWYVASAQYNSANEGQTISLSPIIDDDILMFYRNPNTEPMDPTAAKAFYWQPGGGLGGIREYYDDSKDATVLKWKEQWDMVVVGADAGFFIDDITD
jgi:hypothetical protein